MRFFLFYCNIFLKNKISNLWQFNIKNDISNDQMFQTFQYIMYFNIFVQYEI